MRRGLIALLLLALSVAVFARHAFYEDLLDEDDTSTLAVSQQDMEKTAFWFPVRTEVKIKRDNTKVSVLKKHQIKQDEPEKDVIKFVNYYKHIGGKAQYQKPAGWVQNLEGDERGIPAVESSPAPTFAIRKLGIEVEVLGKDESIDDSVYHKSIVGISPKQSEVMFFVPLLAKELSLYSKEFLAKIPLKKIVLASNLRFKTTGINSYLQPRTAVPVYKSGTLYLDPKPKVAHRLSHNIHHELYHMIDYSVLGNQYDKDDEFSKLNPVGSKYGNGGHQRQFRGSNNMDRDPVTYVSQYSVASVLEDKAETFARLMNENMSMENASDGVVKKKINLIKKRLGEFHSSINNQFWAKVGDHKNFYSKYFVDPTVQMTTSDVLKASGQTEETKPTVVRKPSVSQPQKTTPVKQRSPLVRKNAKYPLVVPKTDEVNE